MNYEWSKTGEKVFVAS